MEIEPYCNECVSSNILEKQDKFPLNESFHHFTRLHWSFIDSNKRGNQAVYRSSHQRCSVRKVVPRDFAKFAGNHPCQRLRPATLLKKRFLHRSFPVNFAKFLRTPFL